MTLVRLVVCVAAMAKLAMSDPNSNVTSVFLEGDLGTVSTLSSISMMQSLTFSEAALNTVKAVLVQTFGATGSEDIRTASDDDDVDDNGDRHVRYNLYLDGLLVEGAALVMHVDGSTGQVYALNGEYAPTKSDETSFDDLTCEEAVDRALAELSITDGEYLSDCTLGAVYATDGYFRKAWRALVGYTEDGSYERSLVFASPSTGDLLALHPQIFGARSLQTLNCKGSTSCNTITLSPNKIRTGNAAIDDAHNHAVDTYNFYKSLGRDSLDNKGATIVSNVNYDKNMNNAYFDNTGEMYYGTGDGVTFTYFSKGLDVCAHELTHGVTHYSSQLIYSMESGALNEAMSDIMGATVDRVKGGKDITDTWLMGEDLYIQPGNAVRDMSNPARLGGADYYPTRYLGSKDGGYVHRNSGIANLAFYLMVQGGKHPRGMTSVQVPAISSDFDVSILTAAKIFYKANTMCLTPSSTFNTARKCTIALAGAYASNVAAAWDAVGVTGSSSSSGGRKNRNRSLCLNLIKKQCSCSAFNAQRSNCWQRTAMQQCTEGATVAQLRKQWQRHCKNR